MTTSNQPLSSINYRQNAFWVLATLTGIQAVSAMLFFVSQNGDLLGGAQLPRIYNLAVLGLCGLSLLWLQRGGPTLWAVGLTLLGIFGQVSITVTTTSGLGPFLAAVFLTAYVVIFLITLPPAQAIWGIGLSAVGAASILVYDFWGPATRPVTTSPWLTPLAYGAAAIFLLLFLGQFRFFNLRVKLTVLAVFFAVLPLTLLAVIYDQTSRDALTDASFTALEGSAAQVAATLDGFIDNSLDNVDAEARLPVFAEYLSLSPTARLNSSTRTDSARILQALKNRSSYISSYALLDLTGLNVLDSAARSLDPNEGTTDYFQQVLATKAPYVSYVQLSPATQQLSLYFSAPVYDANLKVVGVLRARYNALVLQGIIADANGRIGDNSFAVLVDESDILLGHGLAPFLVNHSLVPLPPSRLVALQANHHLPTGHTAEELSADMADLATALQGAQLHFYAELHNDEESREAAAGHRLTTRPWTVVMAQPEVTFLRTINAQSRGAVLFGFTTAFLAALLAVLGAQVFTQPLNQLAAVAQQFSAGNLAARARLRDQDEIGALASTFNGMAEQLQQTLTNLEQRVNDRTRALTISAAISRRLSTLLREEEVLRELVTRVQADFGYYYVQIYLVEEATQTLRLAYGSGAIGPMLVARGITLAVGDGFVGRAAETNAPVVVPDTAQQPQWVAHDLLPLTRAEAAVPIALGETVLGVLEVQHSQAQSLQESNVDVLRALASQAAIALRNARIYAATQQETERKLLIATIGERLRATSSADAALQVAVREIAHAMQARQVGAHLRPPTETKSS